MRRPAVRSLRMTVSLLGSAPLALVAACNPPTGCDAAIRTTLDQGTRTVRVGDAFTPVAKVYLCGGAKLTPDTWQWTSLDTTVARTDALTGRTTGVAPGTTQITGKSNPHAASVAVTLTVAP